MRRHHRPLLLGLCLVGMACSPLQAQSPSDEITGEVRFVGKAPAAREIDRSIEPGCENGTAYVETVLSWDGKLANVHVSIEAKPDTRLARRPVPTKPIIVQQADCIYVPRVQGVVRGQKVLVVNGDPNMHNVHAKSGGDSLSNKSQPARAAAMEIDSSEAGEVLELGCDVHKWMRAYLPVTEHPYFDVTGPDGAFRIAGLPKGKTVTVRAWHEKLGVQRKDVVVGESVTFTFAEL